MATSATAICNASLGKIGAKRIVDLSDDTETSPSAIQCRLHYTMTRDALLRSHWWRFASARATLVQDGTDPTGDEWDNQFILPVDFLRMKSIYENRFSDENLRSYALEGQRLLTNESTMEIRYIRKVTATGEFDPLFDELLVLHLARKLVGPLAGGDPKLKLEIKDDINDIMPSVKAMDAQETNTIGQYDLETWNNARYTG